MIRNKREVGRACWFSFFVEVLHLGLSLFLFMCHTFFIATVKLSETEEAKLRTGDVRDGHRPAHEPRIMKN